MLTSLSAPFPLGFNILRLSSIQFLEEFCLLSPLTYLGRELFLRDHFLAWKFTSAVCYILLDPGIQQTGSALHLKIILKKVNGQEQQNISIVMPIKDNSAFKGYIFFPEEGQGHKLQGKKSSKKLWEGEIKLGLWQSACLLSSCENSWEMLEVTYPEDLL